MGDVSLSVVMPVFNEAAHVADTIDALVAALDGSGFVADVIVVDDGSTDGTVVAAQASGDGRVALRVLRQPNRGRFEARRAGLDAADGEWVLLLDGRVRIGRDALSYVHARVGSGADVWTAHVDIDADHNLYALFWKLLAELAWDDYFSNPREASFGAAEFDRYPKGTTCFFAPRQLLVEAVTSFRSRYADLRHANDDTSLLRWIAERRAINVSPLFRCTYRPRTTLQTFLRHAFHRGVVFVDGHGTRDSRFFPVVVAFYPLSAALVSAALRKPIVAPFALAATGATAAAFGIVRGRDASELVALAAVTPPYAVAHGAGMWRGLLQIVISR